MIQYSFCLVTHDMYKMNRECQDWRQCDPQLTTIADALQQEGTLPFSSSHDLNNFLRTLFTRLYNSTTTGHYTPEEPICFNIQSMSLCKAID